MADIYATVGGVYNSSDDPFSSDYQFIPDDEEEPDYFADAINAVHLDIYDAVYEADTERLYRIYRANGDVISVSVADVWMRCCVANLLAKEWATEVTA